MGAGRSAAGPHADLKPANMRLASENAVKLLDFGLAKAIDDPTALREGLRRRYGSAAAEALVQGAYGVFDLGSSR
jgi:serine/threonine protein kinase